MIFRDFDDGCWAKKRGLAKTLKIIADREHEAWQTGIAPDTTNRRRFT